MTGSSVVGVGAAFENGNTSFFVEVPTSNTFFRLLCLTERIFTAVPQLPARGSVPECAASPRASSLLVVQIPLHDQLAVAITVDMPRRVIAFPRDEDVPASPMR